MADLNICAMCKSDCVVPVDWEDQNTNWLIHRRCGACGWRSVGIWSDEVAERYDEALNVGANAIARALCILELERFEEEGRRFVHALAAGHILPEDFKT